MKMENKMRRLRMKKTLILLLHLGLVLANFVAVVSASPYIPEEIKIYLANMYCGGTTTLNGVKDFNEDCALNKLRTPLPAGYTHDTICVAAVIDWAYANIGWEPVPEAIKVYIAVTYGGGSIRSAGNTAFGADCALNTLKTPLPASHTHDTICSAEVADWAATNIGWTPSTVTIPDSVKNYLAVTYGGGSITTAGKDYIATNFGVGNCFATSGLSWTAVGTDGSTASESGGTASIVGRLVNTAVYREIRITAPHTGTFTYAQLKAANGGQDISLPEVASEIVGVTYCVGTSSITTAGMDNFFADCALNNLRTPLPSGYTHDTICTMDIINWGYRNIGYTPSGPTASAMTWYVDDNGEADFTRIQDAINTASAGDIIIVRDGTYIENVDMDNSLTIQSENGPASTIVQAANSSDHVFNVTADYVNISGFTVKGAGYLKNGMYLYYVNHCGVFDNNVLNNSFGIMLDYSSNNDIIDNKVSNSSVGILLKHDCYNNVIRNNNLYLICKFNLFS